MKKSILKFTAISCAVAGACALFAGCGSENSGSAEQREEFYGLGAVSCVEILGSSLNMKSVKTFASLAKTAGTATDGVKEQAENFNKYFAALDSFLDDSALSIKSEKNTDEAYAQFVMKLTVNGKDIAGNATQYVMYYNETFIDQKVDKDETESRYALEGVMLSEGVEYRLTGGKEIETEDGEREEELKIRAYTGEGYGNFVEMNPKFPSRTAREKTSLCTGYMPTTSLWRRLPSNLKQRLKTARRRPSSSWNSGTATARASTRSSAKKKTAKPKFQSNTISTATPVYSR